MPVTIVTGDRDAGKTRWVAELADRRPVWGFISPKRFDGGVPVGYDLLTLPAADRRPLARTLGAGPPGAGPPGPGPPGAGPPGANAAEGRWFTYRRFRFCRDTFDRAREEARRALADPRQGPAVQPQLHPDTVLVLDEVGPLEADGDGFREVLDRVLASRRPAVLTTRPGLVDWLAGLAGEDRVDVVDLTDPGR